MDGERYGKKLPEVSIATHCLLLMHKVDAFSRTPFYTYTNPDSDRVTHPRSYSKQMAQAGFQPRHASNVLADRILDTRRMLDAKMDKDVGSEESPCFMHRANGPTGQ